MKKLFVCFLVLVLSACGLQEPRRTQDDALAIAEELNAFDVIHFVVSANCDYDYFFEYAPMRVGGFYAYGYKEDTPQLLIIPRNPTDEAKVVDWPIHYTVSEAMTLLDSYLDDDLDKIALYSDTRIELTSSVLNAHHHTLYDVPFFIVLNVQQENYIAFQQNHNLVIYHENDGLLIADTK